MGWSSSVVFVGLFAFIGSVRAAELRVEPERTETTGEPECTMDEDCGPNFPHCNVAFGVCVECVTDDHCPEGWACDPTVDTCEDACTVDTDCEGIDGATHCDADGWCRQCLVSSDCAPEEWCGGLQCNADVCPPGTTFCFGHTIMTCGDDGGPDRVIETCEFECTDADDGPICVGGGTDGSEGGTGSGGSDGGGTVGTTAAGSSDDAGSDGTGVGDTGMPMSDGGGGTGGTTGDDGCSCRGNGMTSPWWALLLVGLARRRMRPQSA